MLFLQRKTGGKKITHVHAWKDKLILFKQTPAEVCKQCGETYLKPEVVEVFDKATSRLDRIKQAIQVPVMPFPQLLKNRQKYVIV